METDIDCWMNNSDKVDQNVLDKDENSIVSMLGDANLLALEGNKDDDRLDNAKCTRGMLSATAAIGMDRNEEG